MSELQSFQEPERKNEGWWLRLAAPPGAGQYDHATNRQRREHLRHAKLTAYLAPFVFVAPLLFLPQASNLGTAIGMVVIMSMSVVILLLNRAGKQVGAALLLVFSLDGVLEGTLLTAPGGLGSGWLLTFDLFIFPLCVVGVLLHRRYIWMFVLLHIGMILGDFYFLHHAPDLITLINDWHNPTVVFVRPVLLQIGCGLVCWLSVGSTDEAISRADRAELITRLQASIAREKQQLEDGIQELVVVLSNAANGNYASSAQLPRDSALWRIGIAIETLFARLRSGRQTEQATQQLLREIQTLTSLVRAARSGQAVQWPGPNNGMLDPLVRELRALVPGISAESSFEENASFSQRRTPPARL